MQTITITLIARDDQDVLGITADLEDSQVLNNWPVFSWETRDSTIDESNWLTNEYGD